MAIEVIKPPRNENKSPAARLFNDQERAVLQYTDEVAENIRVADESFAKVNAFLSDQEIVELTATIGYDGMVSRILESLQIELEA